MIDGKYVFGERLTVDFDSQSYYYGEQYFDGWDGYGEQNADTVNQLLDLAEEYVLECIENKIEDVKKRAGYWFTRCESKKIVQVLEELEEELKGE